MSDFFVKSKKLGIKNVHLNSGEDIIGTVTQYDVDGTYHIDKPVMPNIGQDPQSGNWTVGLLPLRPYLGKSEYVDVPKASVAYVVDVGEKMERLYQQMTSSIAIPTTGDLNSLLGPTN